MDKEVPKIAEVSKKVTKTFSAVDTYPDHCPVADSTVVGADKACTNFGNTGLDDKAKTAVDVRRKVGALTRTGANLGLSEKETPVKHGGAIFEVTAESGSHYTLSPEKPDPDDTASLSKLLDIPKTHKVHEPVVEKRKHLSYPGAIEVGIENTGATKLVVGTGGSPSRGTGNITCTLPIDDFAKEAEVGTKSPKVTGSRNDGTKPALRLIRGRIETDPTKTVVDVEKCSKDANKNTMAVTTGRTANGLGEVLVVDTGTVGGKGRGASPKKGETTRKPFEEKSPDVSTEETEKTQGEEKAVSFKPLEAPGEHPEND